MIRSLVFYIVATMCIFQAYQAENDFPENIRPILQSEGQGDPSPGPDCMKTPRPSSGKVARLLLELLKLLEGEDSTLTSTLTHHLVSSHLLIHPSLLDAEPDLEALVKAPAVMMGEPHAFLKILGSVWLMGTDPEGLKERGWCDIRKVNNFLSTAKPLEVARKIRSFEPILEQTRMIMEDFVKNITIKTNMIRSSEKTATPILTKMDETTAAMLSSSLLEPKFQNIKHVINKNSASLIVFEKLFFVISILVALNII